MKRFYLLALALLYLFAMTGCGATDELASSVASTELVSSSPSAESGSSLSSAPENKEPVSAVSDAGTAPVSPKTLGDKLKGCYRLVDALDGGGQLIRIYEAGGVLLIENCLYSTSDGIFDSWVQEVWPDDETALQSSTASSIHGVSQIFRAREDEENYWDASENVTAALTDKGITMTNSYLYYDTEVETDSGEFERVRDEGFLHTELAGLKKSLGKERLPAEVVGSWCAELENAAILLTFNPDGSVFYAAKGKERPLLVRTGAWNEDELLQELHLLSESIGDDKMLRENAVSWKKSGDKLILEDKYGALLAAEGAVTFSPLEEGWTFPKDLLADYRPVEVYEDLGRGEFINSDTGDKTSYSYSLFRLREDIPGAAEVNQDIAWNVEQTVLQQLADIEDGKTPVYSSIWCEVFKYQGMYSFVFTLERTLDNEAEYYVAYFDLNSGASLDSTSFLAQANIDYFNDFLPAAVDAGQQFISVLNPDLPPSAQTDFDDALERTKHYVGLFGVDCFIGFDGTVFGIVPVAQIVGPEYSYYQLDLGLTFSVPTAEPVG